MNELKVRVSKIIIKNIKNTEYGEVIFPLNKKDVGRRASVLGIYGANGSGKTAVIYTLDILKKLMSGKNLSKDIYNYITKDKDHAYLKFDFKIEHQQLTTFISYEFKLNKLNEDKTVVLDEKITYKTGNNSIMTTLIDTTFIDKETLFSPKTKFNKIKKDKDLLLDLMVSKKMAKEKYESFIFRKETFNLLKEVWDNKNEINLIKRLNDYAQFNLFILLNKKIDYLPFFYRFFDQKEKKIKSELISIDNGVTNLNDKDYKMYKQIVNHLSLVISEIIPGVELTTNNYGKSTLKDGSIINKIELISKKGDLKIPIKYESKGIKKIISILSALNLMFNNEGVLVAIDELDSGVFEYLLGALLEVVNDTGAGQLIFTSHNLHPLELLETENIIFTTTNPINRYIKLINVKDTSNLRSFFLREVALKATGQKEVVYDDIKKHKISQAFRKEERDYSEPNG